jgi:hypothetical protein
MGSIEAMIVYLYGEGRARDEICAMLQVDSHSVTNTLDDFRRNGTLLILLDLFLLKTGKQTKFVETHFCAFGIDAEHLVEIINVMGEELIIDSST